MSSQKNMRLHMRGDVYLVGLTEVKRHWRHFMYSTEQSGYLQRNRNGQPRSQDFVLGAAAAGPGGARGGEEG